MGLIVRSTKAGSTTSFATSFSLGNTLLVADLDTDLNTIYTTVNGSIDENNLANSAVITSKIAALAVTSTKLDAASVTNSKLASDSVSTVKIQNLNVTAAKLAVGAAIPASVSGPPVSDSATNAEKTLLTLPSITTRGGSVLLAGTIGWNVGFLTSQVASVIIILKRAGVAIFTHDFTVEMAAGENAPVPTPFHIDTPAAGSYVYSIAALTTHADVAISSSATNGKYFAVELA